MLLLPAAATKDPPPTSVPEPGYPGGAGPARRLLLASKRPEETGF